MSETLFDKAALTAITFGLTTIVGGALTTFYQYASWSSQQRLQKASSLRDAREKLFAEVSRLLDARLYRLKQLHWNLAADNETRAEKLADYRSVVYEWNDSINRILSLLQVYFSKSVRSTLDNDVGARLVKIGGKVENRYRQKEGASADLAREIDDLAVSIIDFNVEMLELFDFT